MNRYTSIIIQNESNMYNSIYSKEREKESKTSPLSKGSLPREDIALSGVYNEILNLKS